MKKTYIAVAVSLAAGIAVAAIALRPDGPLVVKRSTVDAGQYFDQSAATDERIRALEAAVAQERNARQVLEEELLALFAELDALRDDAGRDTAQDSAENAAEEEAAAFRARRTQVYRRFQRGAGNNWDRTEILVEGGFMPDRAAWIAQRESALRVEALQARYEAQREGDMQGMLAADRAGEEQLRNEIGDADYEKYLEAYDRPTTVTVGSVIQTSPGQLAGLQPGDSIVSYDGQRVFSYSDLNNQQLQGSAGESVVVDLLRDGTPMQIVLPRGPIGIQAGRFRGR